MEEPKKGINFVSKKELQDYLFIDRYIHKIEAKKNNLLSRISSSLFDGIFIGICTSGMAIYTGIEMYNGKESSVPAILTGIGILVTSLSFYKRQKDKKILNDIETDLKEAKNSPKYTSIDKLLE